ncbi:MAG TPA: cupin domain-containing protein [Stellaceae bacterium]|nr:cupin domain-containing protein [Stellaceae bacterium]
MTIKVRRVVTGHDAKGKAIVTIDEMAKNIVTKRPGYSSCVIWSTEKFPSDNADETDGATRNVATSTPNGTVFRVVEYEPGVAPRMHRTDSLDYAIVIAGELEMELDDGVTVHLKAGDVVVQRGTVHNWINRGPQNCVIAYVLTGAEPLVVGAKKLDAFG